MKWTCDDDDRASGRPGEDRGDAALRGRDPAAPWAEEATPLAAPATSRPGDGRLQAASLNRRPLWRHPRPRTLATHHVVPRHVSSVELAWLPPPGTLWPPARARTATLRKSPQTVKPRTRRSPSSACQPDARLARRLRSATPASAPTRGSAPLNENDAAYVASGEALHSRSYRRRASPTSGALDVQGSPARCPTARSGARTRSSSRSAARPGRASADWSMRRSIVGRAPGPRNVRGSMSGDVPDVRRAGRADHVSVTRTHPPI